MGIRCIELHYRLSAEIIRAANFAEEISDLERQRLHDEGDSLSSNLIATDIEIGFLRRSEERGPRFRYWAATSHHVEEDLASSKKLFSGIHGPRGTQDV